MGLTTADIDSVIVWRPQLPHQSCWAQPQALAGLYSLQGPSGWAFPDPSAFGGCQHSLACGMSLPPRPASACGFPSVSPSVSVLLLEGHLSLDSGPTWAIRSHLTALRSGSPPWPLFHISRVAASRDEAVGVLLGGHHAAQHRDLGRGIPGGQLLVRRACHCGTSVPQQTWLMIQVFSFGLLCMVWYS